MPETVEGQDIALAMLSGDPRSAWGAFLERVSCPIDPAGGGSTQAHANAAGARPRGGLVPGLSG